VLENSVPSCRLLRIVVAETCSLVRDMHAAGSLPIGSGAAVGGWAPPADSARRRKLHAPIDATDRGPAPRAACDAEGLIFIDPVQELDLRTLIRFDDPGRAQTEKSHQGGDAQAARDQQYL
jgi:hypothetical protein